MILLARGLHQAPIQFKPQFKMVLTCNVLPEINASDRGTWRRVRKVEFKSVFTDKPDPDDPFQFEIDEEWTIIRFMERTIYVSFDS